MIKNNAAVGAKIAVELSRLLNSNIHSDILPKVVAIGGTNVDITARSGHQFELKTSNLGSNKVVIGGVARNITECLCRLGLNQTLLISILGNDFYQKMSIENFVENQMVTFKPPFPELIS